MCPRSRAGSTSCVTDVFSRMILGWSMASHRKTDLVVDAVTMAVHRRGAKVPGVIHHSDYAGVCVKPRVCGDGCARGSCWWISRLNVSRLSQTVEGLELVFGERLGGGVDGGSNA
jgi:hypothetical protein